MLGKDTTTIHTLTPQGGIPRQEFSASVALACWQLWKARNAFVFRNETQTISQVLGACKAAEIQAIEKEAAHCRPMVSGF
jgi:hypothetical protein